jgi:hypothetical protein
MAGFVEGSNAFAWPIALTHESSEKKMVEMEKGEVHVLNAGEDVDYRLRSSLGSRVILIFSSSILLIGCSSLGSRISSLKR